jgi:hypothetical protein
LKLFFKTFLLKKTPIFSICHLKKRKQSFIFYKKKAKASILKNPLLLFSQIKNNNNRLIINQLRSFSKHHLPHRLRITRRVRNRNHDIIITAHEVDCGDEIARRGVKLESDGSLPASLDSDKRSRMML